MTPIYYRDKQTLAQQTVVQLALFLERLSTINEFYLLSQKVLKFSRHCGSNNCCWYITNSSKNWVSNTCNSNTYLKFQVILPEKDKTDFFIKMLETLKEIFWHCPLWILGWMLSMFFIVANYLKILCKIVWKILKLNMPRNLAHYDQDFPQFSWRTHQLILWSYFWR